MAEQNAYQVADWNGQSDAPVASRDSLAEPFVALERLDQLREVHERTAEPVDLVDDPRPNSLKGVRKSFDGMEVIQGIDCEIADGEFVVILGPSGCGKSTLLRMIAGLEAITSGEIAIGGRVVNELEPKDRDIAMAFQNYALYPHMLVYDNMSYGLRIRGMSKVEIETRVQKAARIQLTVRLPGSTRIVTGDTLSLVTTPGSLHVFDARTGARL